jgi:hypothetical protein
MSKKSLSWIELIKLKLNEEKSKGKSPSINDIMPEAKKEWAQIKAGTHPKYMQGKPKTYARKKKDSNKMTRKADKSSSGSSSGSSGSSGSADIQKILAEVKMCGKCKKKVEKMLGKKNMTGGYNQFYDVPQLGNSDGTLTGDALPGNVTGFDKNIPTHTPYNGKGGGKGKGKGKGSKKTKQKGGCVDCGGASMSGGNCATCSGMP